MALGAFTELEEEFEVAEVEVKDDGPAAGGVVVRGAAAAAEEPPERCTGPRSANKDSSSAIFDALEEEPLDAGAGAEATETLGRGGCTVVCATGEDTVTDADTVVVAGAARKDAVRDRPKGVGGQEIEALDVKADEIRLSDYSAPFFSTSPESVGVAKKACSKQNTALETA